MPDTNSGSDLDQRLLIERFQRRLALALRRVLEEFEKIEDTENVND